MDGRAGRLMRRWGARLAEAAAPRLSWPGGVVSFTFDDFPRSSLEQGGAILERFGARGTFYTALGLEGGDGELGPLFRREDLERAAAAGHEIGCHTFSHIDCAKATAPEVASCRAVGTG